MESYCSGDLMRMFQCPLHYIYIVRVNYFMYYVIRNRRSFIKVIHKRKLIQKVDKKLLIRSHKKQKQFICSDFLEQLEDEPSAAEITTLDEELSRLQLQEQMLMEQLEMIENERQCIAADIVKVAEEEENAKQEEER